MVFVPTALQGLSPRVRGNRAPAPCEKDRLRSIPACAGEPTNTKACCPRCAVYPRVCGGTVYFQQTPYPRNGLSPRVRGNLAPGSAIPLCAGSIPACAGEPRMINPKCRRLTVYPRVCGGTPPPGWRGVGGVGLSPRVRGNLVAEGMSFDGWRSIPACAGEPSAARIGWPGAWVYPRVCGGTTGHVASYAVRRGLSPRVRGNHAESDRKHPTARSIPACAGEPPLHLIDCGHAGVYPRVCGGTGPRRRHHPRAGGLSPRVRGNPGGRTATAGRTPRVYPRVCGGTTEREWPSLRGDGLSPRVRGNREWRPSIGAGAGSIPACAGEPGGLVLRRQARAVYPRVCGGTAV